MTKPETGRPKTGLFWLHVKKSAGISVRRMLAPLYVEVDRVRRPPCFIQSRREAYNDILNCYRVVLGDYQFRRCLFARDFLYPDDFEDHLRFAFSRDPVDRCLSQFHYLWHPEGLRYRLHRRVHMARQRRFGDVTAYEFDRFLDAIAAAQGADANDAPFGLHFRTHIAPMWDDIVDEEGRVLLDHIFRVEDLVAGIDFVRAELGAAPVAESARVHLNRTERTDFAPDRAQRRRIEALFAKDFEIYEGLCDRIG